MAIVDVPAKTEQQRAELPAALRQHYRALTPREERFAQLTVLYNNNYRAWVESHVDQYTGNRATAYNAAVKMNSLPWVIERVRELRSDAARACRVDLEALIARDRAIVEGAASAKELSRIEIGACRRCHGINHKYQWIDSDEFEMAICTALEAASKNGGAVIQPNDDGGYGFSPHNEPHVSCPQCEGRGHTRTIVGDTRTLSPGAAALFKGVKETKNGIEILTHDVDKAADRLYRATGAYGDDAASVARGAVAGAMAGAAAAQHLADRVATMTPEEKRKAYLQLVS